MPHGKGRYAVKAWLASQDDGFSMWSRPFTFAGHTVRVEEGWGIGIGETILVVSQDSPRAMYTNKLSAI